MRNHCCRGCRPLNVAAGKARDLSSPDKGLHDVLCTSSRSKPNGTERYKATRLLLYNFEIHQLIKQPSKAHYTTQPNANLPRLSPRLLISLISIAILLMSMPNFLNRLLRPFTTSTSLGVTAPMTSPEGYELATIAAGCFWGVEHMFRKEFNGKGLHDARVGYIGGDTNSPSYRAVCSGNTGRMFSPPSPFCLI